MRNYYELENNPEFLFNVIASLHNELFAEVTGSYYDYMFHWTNKGGYDDIKDDLFKEGD